MNANRARLDRLAVLTFLLSALWLFGLASIAALYVAWLSLRRMKSRPDLRGRTVALAGVAVAVFGVLISGLWIGLSLTL